MRLCVTIMVALCCSAAHTQNMPPAQDSVVRMAGARFSRGTSAALNSLVLSIAGTAIYAVSPYAIYTENVNGQKRTVKDIAIMLRIVAVGCGVMSVEEAVSSLIAYRDVGRILTGRYKRKK